MEQTPKIIQKTIEKEPEINMGNFRAEIGELKTKIRKEQIAGSLELSNINPNDLTLEDARMWYKYKSNLLTEADIVENSVYDRDVEKDLKNLNYNSRENFRAFFRQILTYPQLEEQQKQHENSINGNSKNAGNK